MNIWLNSIYQVAGLIFVLAGFVFLAQRNIKKGIVLIAFLLPLYLVRFNFFFLPLNVSEILIWLIFVVWLAQGGYKNIRLVQIRRFLWPAMLILIGVVLSVLFSDDLRISAGILKGWFIAPVILALIIIGEIKEEKEVKKILAALFGSASLVGVASIFYLAAGWLTFDGRLSAFYLSPNHLAMFLAPGFLIGFDFLRIAESRKLKIVILVGLAVLAAALYFTFSYAAWLSILIVISVKCLVISYKKSKKLFIVYCFLFVILLAILFFSQLHSQKLNNLLFSARSSWQSRSMIWHSAWLIGRDHPIFGIGPGMFQEYYLRYQAKFSLPYLEWAVPQPHNLFLAFWLQTGILGLLGFLWLVFVFFRMAIKQAGVTFSCCGTPRPAASSDSPRPVTNIICNGARCENATPACFNEKNQLVLVLMALMGYIILHGLVDTTYFKNDLSAVFWIAIALMASLGNYTYRSTDKI